MQDRLEQRRLAELPPDRHELAGVHDQMRAQEHQHGADGWAVLSHLFGAWPVEVAFGRRFDGGQGRGLHLVEEREILVFGRKFGRIV